MTAAFTKLTGSEPGAIPARYEPLCELGRGGMAVVHKVRDRADGREYALKQLSVRGDHLVADEALRLFEREFRTLAQLTHPRIIAVYEYGVTEAGPYYTMELLDGGDLRDRAPLSWRDACRVGHDVCSALSLLHSRGFVHRDVSTRNIRCTRDGLAKLIDFGAMAPIGPCAAVVGTAPFVAPEVLNHSTIDARTDVYSLGATLYYALTGRTAYRARRFSDLTAVWRVPPPPPSNVRPQIPAVLDELVLSMLSLDPASRPRSAAEVMARLAEIAGLELRESLDVRQAYLYSPVLVGRHVALRRFERHFARARRGRGGAVAITAAAGLGRTRLLDACVLHAKIAGATVLRCNAASAQAGAWVVAQTLLDQLFEAAPETAAAALPAALREAAERVPPERGATDTVELSARTRSAVRAPSLARSELDARALGAALRDLLVEAAHRLPLVIAIDDLHRADEQSIALVLALALSARGTPLLTVATLESDAGRPGHTGLEPFLDHAARIKLGHLSVAESETLLRHVFGDVPHIATLNAAMSAIADGNPRALLEYAQHLVDNGTIGYESGSWKLPAEIDRSRLPVAIASALAQRVERLAPLALRLARCQALSGWDRFTREDYRGLLGDGGPLAPLDLSALDLALSELVGQRILTSDGTVFTLVHSGLAGALTHALSEDERKRLHAALAQLCVLRSRHVLLAVRHLFDAGETSAALDRLDAYLRAVNGDINRLAIGLPMEVRDVAVLFARAEAASIAEGRPQRELFEIRAWVTMLSASTDDALYFAFAPTLRAQLELDSGLTIARELDPAMPAAERVQTALGRAFERYTSLPERERVYRPDEAIKMLVYFVGASIAVGTRTNDEALLESLPGLLEPFEGLSPVVHTLWQNAIATCEASCRLHAESARERWLRVYEQLQSAQGVDSRYVELVSRAVAFALASCEVRAGLPPSSRWLDMLDGDEFQAVAAAYLRRAWRIQLGDVEGAERLRRQAELLAVQSGRRPMLSSHLPLELVAYAYAYDYAGLREARQRIDSYAARSPGWVPYRSLADGYLMRTRGNFAAALASFDRALRECDAAAKQGRPRLNAWLLASVARVEALTELGRPQEAYDCAELALARCEQLGAGSVASSLRRAFALAEAKLGRYAEAAARLDQLIDEQTRSGALGLTLGTSHEARARVALWSGDAEAFRHHAAATGRQYRRGQGSALGGRYERLIAEARRVGFEAAVPAAAFSLPPSAISGDSFDMRLRIATVMSDAGTRHERAERALRMLCEPSDAREAYLFLSDGDRLELVAQLGDGRPPPGLAAFLQDQLQAEADSTNAATIVEGFSAAHDRHGVYELGDGRSYRAVPLVTGAGYGHAGIAALALNDDASARRTHTQLADAIAQYLLDTGDCTAATRGVG